MTAPTTNGHRSLGDLLRKQTDASPNHPGQFGAYPKDPYPTLDVDEVEVVAEAPAGPDPNAEDTGSAPPAMYPVVPPWMKTGEGLRRNVGHNAPILANRIFYWGFWPNWFAVRPIGWAFRGAWRAGCELASFAFDLETRRMRRDAARRGDGRARSYERQELYKSRRFRAAGTAGWLAAIGAAGMVLTGPEVPLWVRVPLGLVGAGVLANVGRPTGETTGSAGVLMPHEDQDPAKTIVHSDRVISRFDAAGIHDVMTLGGTHRRDHGAKGWEAIVDLPDGTTVDEVLAKHLKLCSAWKIGKERLYLRREGHEGQVRMTLFDEDPMTMDPVRTPLRDLKTRSLWDPVPIGTTAYGDPYSLVLPGTSGVWVCSAPGYGKTNFIQLLLAAAALGIRVRIFIHDGKGEGDLEVYRDLADHFSQGANDAAGRDCLKMLADVRDLRDKRRALIRRVKAEAPDLMRGPQITREVTEDPKWGLELILFVVDELNLMVKTESGEDIQTHVTDIAEGCRSGGIIPVIAGQNFRAGVLDGAQASIGTRVAFKTNTPADSNMILGQGQVGEGFNTSRWPDHYQGVAVIRPAGKQVQSGTHQVKVHLGEYKDHVAIAAHAGRQRIAAGAPVVLTKTGAADLLDQVLEVIGDRNVVAVDDIAEALELDVETLVADLREAKVPVEPSRQHGNRRAVRRRDVLARM